MDKYLAKPTEIIDHKGYVKGISNVEQNVDDTNARIAQLEKKLNAEILDTTAIQEVRERVYNLEQFDAGVHEMLDTIETTANEASRTATIAHNVVNEFVDSFSHISTVAGNAEKLALEAATTADKNAGHCNRLEERVTVLESLDGSPVVNVGPQRMGVNSTDTFTVTWNKGNELRTLSYASDNILSEIIDFIHEPLANGFNNFDARITALESGSVYDPSVTPNVGSCSCNETLAAIDARLKTIEETEYVNLQTYKATYMVKSSTNDNELLTSTRVTARIDVIGSTNGDSINVVGAAVNNLNTKINLVDGSVQAYAEIIESNKSRITALEENQTPTDLTELQSDVSMLKTAVQNHNTKITALQSKDCLTRELTVKPYENYTQDQCDRWGVDKNASMTLPADQMIQGAFMLVAANQADFNYLNETTIPALETRVAALESASATTASDDLVVIDQQISTLNNRVNLLENNVTNNTTKIGVHTTDIAALQNRVVDLETQVSTQATIISELLSRIEALEGKS